MKNSLNLGVLILFVLAIVSCSKSKDGNFESRIKFDAKPQVKDILQGKSKAEVLKMKYKALLVNCTVEAQKITKFEDTFQTLSTSPEPPAPDNPVSNPKKNTVVYDIKLQQLVDRELTKDVVVNLTSTKDNQELNLELTFKPLSFQEALNIDMNKKKYIMKHTPVMTYQGNFQLLHSDSSTIVGKIQGKIFEKIHPQESELIAVEIGHDKYVFMMSCSLDPSINPENATLAAEFNNQWTEIDCLAPKNELERAVCK